MNIDTKLWAKTNEICDQNVTEVENWHALNEEKETLTPHESATVGITGKKIN